MKPIIAITACLLIALAGCKKKGCFESGGTAVTSIRTINAPFKQIHVNDNINIVLTQDTVNTISIEAGDHLQPFIKADIQNNILTLSNNSACSWLKGPSETITAHISVKVLDSLVMSGSGTISSSNTLVDSSLFLDSYEAVSPVTLDLEVKALTLLISEENAEYDLSGSAAYASVYCGQKGTMNLGNLQVVNMDLDQRSIRDAHVWVTGTLNVRVQYKGNVYYKGNPSFINYTHYNDGRLLPFQ
ncbi:MAG TPA: DUF2807 domain-containing protein [Chitinophagaceae bacterium]|jgi:hypothetical protein